MSLEYAERKIREALEMSKGNQARAQHMIMAMAEQDMKLLQGLTDRHLTGIVAFHVERVVSGRSSEDKNQGQDSGFRKQVQEASPFGREILKAVTAQRAEVFGFDSGAPTGRRAKASQTHINALLQMAERSKHKF